VLALEILFLAIFWSWAVSALLFLRNTVLPRQPIAWPPGLLQVPAQTVRFRATDGVELEGWTIQGESARPWIILCHGLGANRSDLLQIAVGLREAGFNLLLFDFRGHGASGGRATSFGWHEQRDLEGALTFLGRQPEAPLKPYGVYGISMGGSVALMVAARDERLGAVAVDSPYADLEESLGRHLSLMYPLPKIPFLWFILATYRLRFGVWPRRVSPQESVAHVSPRPVLFIQGERDSRMLPEGARRLFAKAGQPKHLWIVEGAEHLEAFSLEPTRYLARVVRFFQSSLR